MGQDIASLGIRVTSEGIQKAEQDLARLAKAGANVDGIPAATDKALSAAGVTWKQFIAERMGDYMRLEGGHSAAMKRIAAEWKDYKASISNGLGTQATQQVAAIGPAMQKAAVSAAQLQAATRGLQAQFTDIVTSLQAGQNPLQVLLQQGGQIKDQFGGIGAAAQAMGGYVAGLVTPMSVAAVAVATLGVAMYSEAERAERFGIALVRAGNNASLAKAELEGLSRSLDELDGVTRGVADDAIVALIANTRLGGAEFRKAAEAVAEWSSLTGESAESVARKMKDLGREPYQALLRLAEGGANVTTEMLDAARSLQESGKSADAAKIAFNAMVADMESKNDRIRDQLSGWSRLWRDIKDEASGAWSAITRTTGAMIDESYLRGEFDLARARRGEANGGPEYEREFQSFRSRRRSDAAVDAAFAASAGRNASARQQVVLEDARVKDKPDRKTPKPRALSAREDGTSLLAQLRQQVELNRAATASQDALTTSERLAVTAKLQLEQITGKLTTSRRAEIAAALEALKTTDAALEQYKREEKAKEEAAKRLERETEEVKSNTQARADYLADLEFEIALIGKSAIEQERMIALRQLGAQATAEDRRSLLELLDTRERLIEQERILNDVKGAATDMFASFMDGSQSAGDAFEDFTKRLRRLAAQMLAEKAIQYIFSLFGGGGGAYTGDGTGPGSMQGFGSNIGSFMGGGRARGGPVSNGKLYEVGEGGRPELFQQGGRTYLIPGNSGAVVPAMRGMGGSAAGGGGGGGVQINVTNNSKGEVEAQPEVKFDEFGRMIVNMTIAEVDKRIGTMGSTGRAIQGRFGVSPAGASRG